MCANWLRLQHSLLTVMPVAWQAVAACASQGKYGGNFNSDLCAFEKKYVLEASSISLCHCMHRSRTQRKNKIIERERIRCFFFLNHRPHFFFFLFRKNRVVQVSQKSMLAHHRTCVCYVLCLLFRLTIKKQNTHTHTHNHIQRSAAFAFGFGVPLSFDAFFFSPFP